MQIECLELVNFGPYEKATIEFDEHLTVIRGRNWHGKSWIVRALQAVLFNVSETYEKIRYNHNDAKSCSVKLRLVDGRNIIRYWGTKSKFELTEATGEEDTINPGRGTNRLVASFTGIRPLELSSNLTSRIQIQGQHDGDFLLHNSSSNIDQALGRVAGADVLEVAVASVAKDMRKVKTERTSLGNTVQELQGQVDEYSYLPTVEMHLAKATEYKEGYTTRREFLGDIKPLLDQLEELRRELLGSSELTAIELIAGIKNCVDSKQLSEQMFALMSELRNKGSMTIMFDSDIEVRCIKTIEHAEEIGRLLSEAARLVHSNTSEGLSKESKLEQLETLKDSITICPTCGRELDDKDTCNN